MPCLTPDHEWDLVGTKQGIPRNSLEHTGAMGKSVHKVPESKFQYGQLVLMQEFSREVWSIHTVLDTSHQGFSRGQQGNSQKPTAFRGCTCIVPDPSCQWCLRAPTWIFEGALQSTQGLGGRFTKPEYTLPTGPGRHPMQEFSGVKQTIIHMGILVRRRHRGFSRATGS